MADAVILMPGEGEAMPAGNGMVVLKAVKATTGGAFGMSECTIGPGFPGPPPHIHRETYDTFYVLEGELTLRVGSEYVTAPAGTYAAVPPGVVHTFSNPGDADVRFLNINAPAWFEDYLRDLSAALKPGVPPDPAEIGRIAEKYDVVVVPDS